MKHIFSIVLIIILFKPVFPVLDYAVNYDYIAKVLCINKDKPKLQCNGKCYLMQQLAKNAEPEKKQDKEATAKVEFQLLYLEAISSFQIEKQNLTQKHQINKEFLQLYDFEFTSTILQPPRLA